MIGHETDNYGKAVKKKEQERLEKLKLKDNR